jgi:hypothetical protein
VPAVVVHGVLILRFCKCCFCFLQFLCHVFCEFIGQLQFRAWLLMLKACVRVSSGVDHKGGLLSWWVGVVVVAELT